jgi:hypothetical protein
MAKANRKVEAAHQAHYNAAVAEKRGKARQTADDAAAFDAMCADRTVRAGCPRKPPPYRFAGSRVTAGAAALAEDIRAGVYVHDMKMTWDQ